MTHASRWVLRLRSRTVAARAAASGWVVLLAVLLLVGPDGSGHGVGAGWILVVAGIIAAVAVAAPWGMLPRSALVALPVGAIATLLPIQAGVFSTWDPDHALVVLLPIIWLALAHSRRALIAGLVLAAVDFWTPLVTADPARRAVLVAVGIVFSVLTAIVGITVFELLRRQQAEEQAAVLARTDALTGIGNRRTLDESLPRTLARAARDGRAVTLALLDLDQFKRYNDDWGHLNGDRMLALIARTWRELMRADDLLVRFGGDEFAVVFEGCTTDQAESILVRWAERMPAGQAFSAGIAAAQPLDTGAALLGRVDDALHAAKRLGGRGPHVVVFDAAQPSQYQWRDRVGDLVSQRRIGAALQPVVCMRTGTIIGYEALPRPYGEPADLDVDGMFVAAQRLGIARALDAACVAAAVAASVYIPPDALLFINVGVAALLEPEREADNLCAALDRAGRDAATVVLELNESINDLSRFDDAFARYRAAGIRFALDDVGHGHSTLEAFAAVNPEFLKVSQRLTAALDSPSTHATLRGIVAFAQLNAATVIADGLDDARLVPTLAALGITCGQGTAFGAPVWPGRSEVRLIA